MTQYMKFFGTLAIGLTSANFGLVEEARSDTIVTPVAAFNLGTIDTTALNTSIVGPFDLTQPLPGEGGLLTIAISGAFSADGSEYYTLINTLAEAEEDVSSQLGKVDLGTGKIEPIGEENDFNIVAMEIDSNDQILATGFHLFPNPAFPGLNWFGDSKLYSIDPKTGAPHEIGETGIDEGPIMDLAINAKGEVWATTANKLWTLNKHNGKSTFEVEISGVTDGRPPGAEVMGIFFDSRDTLWGTDIVTGDLFTIDTETGIAEFVMETGWVQPGGPHGGDIYVPPVLPPGAINNPGLDGELPPGLRRGLPLQSHHAVPETTTGLSLLLGCSLWVLARRR